MKEKMLRVWIWLGFDSLPSLSKHFLVYNCFYFATYFSCNIAMNWTTDRSMIFSDFSETLYYYFYIIHFNKTALLKAHSPLISAGRFLLPFHVLVPFHVEDHYSRLCTISELTKTECRKPLNPRA